MNLKQRSIETELGRAFGAVLTPVRWVLLLGILASLSPRLGLQIHRPGVLAAAFLYAVLAAGLPHLRGRPFTSGAVERLLLAADVLFSAAIFYASDGIRGPYFALWYFALIHAALLLGMRAGVALAGATAALVVAFELTLPGGREELRNLSHALGTLPFLLLITWAAGRLAQEMRDREAARRRAEQRALTLEAEEVRSRKEMEIARRVQQSLLPVDRPAIPGMTLAALSCPAQEVGGDTYDLIELPDGRLLIAIADVCGKGVPAALLAVAVQQGLRQFAGPEPAAVLSGVNRLLLASSPDDMFVTAACVVVDPRDGSIAAAAAGHPPPLWWNHREGRLVPVTEPGIALGLLPDWSGGTERWRLAPGDALMLYTDGVLDAKLGERDRLGEKRLAELLEGARPEDASEWLARLRRGLDACTERPDDITAVALQWERQSPLGSSAAAKGEDRAVRSRASLSLTRWSG